MRCNSHVLPLLGSKRAVDDVVQMPFPERVDRAVRVEPRPNRPRVLERERRARAYAVMAALNGWRVPVPRDDLDADLREVLHGATRAIRPGVAMQVAFDAGNGEALAASKRADVCRRHALDPMPEGVDRLRAALGHDCRPDQVQRGLEIELGVAWVAAPVLAHEPSLQHVIVVRGYDHGLPPLAHGREPVDRFHDLAAYVVEADGLVRDSDERITGVLRVYGVGVE